MQSYQLQLDTNVKDQLGEKYDFYQFLSFPIKDSLDDSSIVYDTNQIKMIYHSQNCNFVIVKRLWIIKSIIFYDFMLKDLTNLWDKHF